jgi:hypothetical protein
MAGGGDDVRCYEPAGANVLGTTLCLDSERADLAPGIAPFETVGEPNAVILAQHRFKDFGARRVC